MISLNVLTNSAKTATRKCSHFHTQCSYIDLKALWYLVEAVWYTDLCHDPTIFHLLTVGVDFVQQAMQYRFTNNSAIGSQQCANFTIIDDNDVEANETFTAQLNQATSVIFSQQTTTVTILDNECQLLTNRQLYL